MIMTTTNTDQQVAQSETPERVPHEFVPGVKLWGQRLCRKCYKQFYYDIHKPSFAKSVWAIREGR